MNNIATIARILGSFFYFPLSHENNAQLLAALKESDDINESPFGELVELIATTEQEAVALDFQQLFEGCEVMPAPPWGSVYLDREQIVFGDSTIRYRHFLASINMSLDTGMREPEDQFGLMLMAIANIIEEKQDLELVKVLLAEHILPWATHYLELVQKHAQTKCYSLLAEIAQAWLGMLQEELEITAKDLKIYF
ncbi:Tat proofreading chaperone DmsD [Photobacterium makurazakiensis]|uniref:Tat proofreading chaperone DmsD n=1 Tax=Photobacterium makurazakiensis TaxID=2910234 RepID=UPI003D0A663D